MTTVNLQVGAGTDDGYITTPTTFLNAAAFTSFGTDANADGEQRNNWNKFTSVAIANADTIDAATLVYTGQFGESTSVELLIDGNDIDDAVAPTSYAEYVALARTTASVQWDFSTTWTNNSEFTSPELKTIIQEIVDRGGWATGQDIQLFTRDDLDTDSALRRSPYSYDGDTAKACKLDIDFTAGGAQTLTPSGIASLEAFGAATVTLDLQTITADAIASAEAFGSAQLNLAFTASGIPSAEAFGAASISTAVTLSPSGIASAEAFGAATISTVVTLSPSGIASAEAFGAATVTAALQTITGAGIASLEAFGSAQLNLAFTASGIASLEAFGAATVTLAGQTLSPSGIASAEAFGAATLSTAVTITASGIASLETFGAATVSAGVIIFSDYGNWRALIDPGDYPVGTEFVFEAIVATNNGNFPSYAHLYNITDEVVVADSQVQSVNTTDERVRSSALSLPAAPKEYRCERGGVAGATYYCYSANVLPKSG